MLKMLIDTSVWLGLGRDPKDGALISVIETLIKRGALSLIVPRVVLKEFVANRERVAADYGRRLTQHFRIVREAVLFSGQSAAEGGALLDHLDRVEKDVPLRARLADQVFAQVEKILTNASPIDSPDQVLVRVGERARDGRAPFHRGRNSAADAIIIETYAEVVRHGENDSTSRFAFVTQNTDDFSAAAQNEKIPHPDYTCFIPGKSEYFISLPEALRTIDPVSVREMLTAWEFEQPTVGDLLRRYVAESDATDDPLGESQRKLLLAMAQSPLGRKQASKLKVSDVVEHAKRRRGDGRASSTVMQDLIFLLPVLRTAEQEWGILGVSRDPVEEARRQLMHGRVASKSVARNRRPTKDELRRLEDYFARQYLLPQSVINMNELIAFTLETGRGLKEICSLRWADFDRLKGKGCVVHTRKSRRRSGQRQKEFPLTEEAAEIIRRQSREHDCIFPFNRHSTSQAFRNARNDLGIRGLRLQDLRREAVMRMFERQMPIERIEALSGLSLNWLQHYRRQWEAEDAARDRSTVELGAMSDARAT